MAVAAAAVHQLAENAGGYGADTGGGRLCRVHRLCGEDGAERPPRDYHHSAYDGGNRRIYCRQLCQADYPDVGGSRSYRRGSGGAGNSGYRAHGAGN